MPIAGPTAPGLLAQARLLAKAAVYAKYRAIAMGPPQRRLTETEQAAMKLEIESADSGAILAFLVTNTIVTTPAGPGSLG